MNTTRKKRRIAVLTGKRGGFGAMIELMRAIERDPAPELKLIVTDMHLAREFGETVKEIEKWFPIATRIALGQKDDSGKERARALGRAQEKIASALSKLKPDILLLLGDRGEVLSAAAAATELGIPIAHILGGDAAGNRDGVRIHSITKLAHLHFPANRDAYERILKLGEEKWRVKNFGATYIDRVVKGDYTPEQEARKKYNISPDEPFALCIQHPVTLHEEHSYQEARAVYNALKKKKLRSLIVYPCSDQGYEGVIRAIRETRNVPHFSVHKNIEAVDFWGLMACASVMVGNSSSGLMETPYFNLPAVNVGKRQEGRARDTNVIDAEPNTVSIATAIEKALSPGFRKKIRNHYVFGRGNAGERIVKVLKEIPIDEKLLLKKTTF